MMIFLCGGARKLKKSTKRVVFAYQKFYSFLSVYVFLKPGSPPKRGRAHTRTRNGSFCALPFAAFGRIDFAGVCLSVWSLFF